MPVQARNQRTSSPMAAAPCTMGSTIGAGGDAQRLPRRPWRSDFQTLDPTSKLSKECRLSAGRLHQLGAYPELELLQEPAKVYSVNEVDGRRSIPHCLPGCVPREAARRHEQTLVCAPDHCPSEVSDLACSDRTRVPLALKSHVKRNEVDPQHPGPVDTSVTGSARNRDLREARFPQDTLTKTLEGVRLQATQDSQQVFLPVALVRCLGILGSDGRCRLDAVALAPALLTDEIPHLLLRRNRPPGRSDRPNTPGRIVDCIDPLEVGPCPRETVGNFCLRAVVMWDVGNLIRQTQVSRNVFQEFLD